MADKIQEGGRPMIYPYTWTAKLLQFPFKWYFKNGWALKYYYISVLLCLPVFYKIQTLTNSPGNVEKWKKLREEWYGDHSKHH